MKFCPTRICETEFQLPVRGILPALLLQLILIASLPQTVTAAELNITQNQLPVTLGQYLDHYEDSDRELTIADILSSTPNWQRSTQSIPTIGFSSSAHWFYIELSGQGLSSENLILSLESASLDRADVYFVRSGEVVGTTVVGDTIPLSQIDNPYRFPVISVNFDSAQNLSIYFRLSSSGGIDIPLVLGTATDLAKNEQNNLAFFGAFFSFIFLCFCGSGILYYYLRDRQLVGYILFFVSLFFIQLCQTGLGRMWLWGEFVEFNSRLNLTLSCLLVVSFSLIGQSLKFEFRYRDSINTVLRFLVFAMFPFAIYFFAIPFDQFSGEITTPMFFITAITAFLVLLMAGVTAAQGSKAAIYLFFSWLVILLALLSFTAYKFGVVERSASATLIDESLMTLAGILLLGSLIEFVRSKNDELDTARKETKAKGDFLRNVSREFLTPVHLILANSKRLLAAQSNKLDEGTIQHMTTVIKQSDYLHNLINDLLEMAELESDNFEPEFELVEISHFLNEVKDMMLPTAMEKNLDITTEYAAANFLVQTDKARLQHSLLNIITNAIKFTDHGNILLGYKAVYYKRRLGIEIFIRDTGKGMSEDFQKRLFQEFAREDPASEKEPQGTGLGLVIVKRMIEKLGGEVNFESEAEQGSVFFIRLPLRVITD